MSRLTGAGVTAAAGSVELFGLIKELTGVLNPFLDGLKRAVGALTEVADAARPFVQALAPAIVQQFDLQMRNLMATIGSGLLPIFQNFIDVIQEVASVIAPAFEKLAPVIDTITSALGNLIVGQVEVLASVFDLLLPVVQALAEIFAVIVDTMRFFYSILASVIQALAATVGGGLQTAMRELVDVVKYLATELIRLTARIAVFFGGVDFLYRIIKNLQTQQGPHPVAAPLGVSIKGLEQITKDLAAASVIAGGGREHKTDDFLNDILQVLQQVKNESPATIEQALKNAFDTFALSLGVNVLPAFWRLIWNEYIQPLLNNAVRGAQQIGDIGGGAALGAAGALGGAGLGFAAIELLRRLLPNQR